MFFKKPKKESSEDSLSFATIVPLLLTFMSSQPSSSSYELQALREKYHELDKRLMLQESRTCSCKSTKDSN